MISLSRWKPAQYVLCIALCWWAPQVTLAAQGSRLSHGLCDRRYPPERNISAAATADVIALARVMAINGDVATLQIVSVLKAAPKAGLKGSIDVAGIPEDSNKRPCRGNAATTGLHYIVLLKVPAGSGPAFQLIGGGFDAVLEWSSDVEESIRLAVADPVPVSKGNAPAIATPRTVTLATERFPDISYGTLQAPEEYALRTGSTDSLMGTLTRKSDGFTIHFDIGGMAGTHISTVNKDNFALFRAHTVGNNTAFTGIKRANGKQTVVTTIGASSSAANFWTDFTRDEDLLEFMLIVNSYRPKVAL